MSDKPQTFAERIAAERENIINREWNRSEEDGVKIGFDAAVAVCEAALAESRTETDAEANWEAEARRLHDLCDEKDAEIWRLKKELEGPVEFGLPEPHKGTPLKAHISKTITAPSFAFDDEATLAESRTVTDAQRKFDALNAWVTSMPDAGFNDRDPRWEWWHRRPHFLEEQPAERQG